MATLLRVLFLNFLCGTAVNAVSELKNASFLPTKELKDLYHMHTKEEDVETKLLHDLTLDLNQEYNIIYVGIKFEVWCGYKTCERYTLFGLEDNLKQRGKNRRLNDEILYNPYHSNDKVAGLGILNAGSSSRDIIILSLNSNVSLAVMVIIRKYNRKSYIVLICNTDHQFNMAKQYILYSTFFNVYLLRRSEEEEYKMYEVCAYCNVGKHDLKAVNRWNYYTGFVEELKYTSSFKNDFNRGDLRFGMQTYSPPSIFITGITKEGKYIFSGQDYWLVQALSQYLKFNILIIEPEDGTACGQANYSYTGYCKMLLDRQVDIGGPPIAISWWLFQFFDPTAVYYQESNIIVSATPPTKQKWNQVFSICQPIVFLSIFVSYILITVTFYIQQTLSQEDSTIPLMDVIFRTLSILCLESTPVINLKAGEQMVIGVWMLACFFVISGVFAEFTSVTATPGLAWKPVDTLQDMEENGLSWITSTQFDTDEFLLEHLPKLASKSIQLDLKDGLQMVLDKPLEYIFYFPREGISPIIRMYFWNGHGNNPFHFSPSIGDPVYPFTILIAKGSPYREQLTKAMLRLESVGLFMYKYMPDTTETLAKFGQFKPSKVEKQRKFFTMEKMIPPFIVLVAGVILSIICWVTEVAVSRFKHGPRVTLVVNITTPTNYGISMY